MNYSYGPIGVVLLHWITGTAFFFPRAASLSPRHRPLRRIFPQPSFCVLPFEKYIREIIPVNCVRVHVKRSVNWMCLMCLVVKMACMFDELRWNEERKKQIWHKYRLSSIQQWRYFATLLWILRTAPRKTNYRRTNI